MENNAPPCVILKTITLKRGLLLKSSKNLHGKLSIPAKCVESNPKERETIKRGLLLKSSKNLQGKLLILARCVESNPKEKESITVDYAEMVNLSQWVLA